MLASPLEADIRPGESFSQVDLKRPPPGWTATGFREHPGFDGGMEKIAPGRTGVPSLYRAFRFSLANAEREKGVERLADFVLLMMAQRFPHVGK
jgi:hypothetical protein